MLRAYRLFCFLEGSSETALFHCDVGSGWGGLLLDCIFSAPLLFQVFYKLESLSQGSKHLGICSLLLDLFVSCYVIYYGLGIQLFWVHSCLCWARKLLFSYLVLMIVCSYLMWYKFHNHNHFLQCV